MEKLKRENRLHSSKPTVWLRCALLILQLMELLLGFQLAGREDNVSDLDLLEIPLDGDLLVDGEVGVLREDVSATITMENGG